MDKQVSRPAHGSQTPRRTRSRLIARQIANALTKAAIRHFRRLLEPEILGPGEAWEVMGPRNEDQFVEQNRMGPI
jgi:hypothetical protein